MFDEGSGPAAAQRLAGWLRTRKDVAKLKEKAGLIVLGSCKRNSDIPAAAAPFGRGAASLAQRRGLLAASRPARPWGPGQTREAG